MKKQSFDLERSGFYGTYYPNPVPSGKAMIAMVGDSSDDHMAKSSVKWLHKYGCNVMTMSPDKKDYGYHNYPLERIERAIKNLYSQPKSLDGRGFFPSDEANFRRHTCVYGGKGPPRQ